MKKYINGNLKRPNLFLFFAIVSSATVLMLVGIYTYHVLEDVLENSGHSQIIRGRVENIRFFDEVLTNSTLLAASTGNAQWEKRYHLFEPKLDSAINELLRMDPLHAIHQKLQMTDSANVRLKAMEHRVFELIQLEKRNEAYEILTGSEYARQKAMYSEGLSSFIKQHELETDQLQMRLQNAANHSKWFFGLVILLLAFVWLPIERFIRRNRAQMLLQNQELELQIQARKESESALYESQKQTEKVYEQLQDSIKASSVGLWEWNMQTNEVYQSPEFKKQIGYEDDEVENSSEFYFSHLHPDDAIILNESSQQLLAGEIDKLDMEYRYRHKDGSYRWMLSHTSLQRDQYGKPLRLFGSHIDITERKKAEEKINMLAHAVKNSADCIAITDKDYKFIFINDSFCKTFGFKEDEIIGQPILIIHSEHNLPEVSNDLFSTIKEKKIWTGEVLSKRKDGNDFPVQLSLAPLLDNKGELIAIVGVLRDITERKHAEEALRASQQLIEGIINAISVRVFWKDRNLVYLGCNKIFARDAGFSDPKDIIGKDDFQMGWYDQAELYRSGDRQVIESGCPIILNEESQTTPEGNTIILLTNKIPLQNSMGEIIGILGTSMDITDRMAAVQEIKLKNEELIKINAEKDKFFSIIAHDLRSPFNGFLGLTQIMVEELQDMTMDEIQSMAVNMQNSATNLFRLLENLLEWAKMQQGLIPFDPEVMKLLPIVDESIAMVLESAKNKGIEIVCNVPVEIEVFADNHILQTVIRNLLSNAVKFTPKGGEISVSAKAISDKGVEISIKDTGIGMSSKMVDDLFRLDVQTNRKGTEGESSSGLGLLLCKEFVEKHGGKIWVESEEGKGSVFYFTIPHKDKPEEKIVIKNIVSTDRVVNQINLEVRDSKY